MSKTDEIITDEQIKLSWGNAYFGDNLNRRLIIANALLKYACGYYTGYTIMRITQELGLINGDLKLTKLGRRYLFEYYSNSLSV